MSILHDTDYTKLLQKLLELVSHSISKDPKSIFFEDKLIVENSLNLMLGIILYNKELFKTFLDFKGTDKIKTANDFILHGVLFCSEEKIRENFKVFLLHLSIEISDAMSLSLTLLSANFSLISDFPCRQFFDLFNELIDEFFKKKSSSNVFEPETLLSKIIDKIRADQKSRKTAFASLDD